MFREMHFWVINLTKLIILLFEQAFKLFRLLTLGVLLESQSMGFKG